MTAQRVTTFAVIFVLASSVGLSQVKTTVPDVVPGARPATVERVTIHGKALEGNLEGDAVDRPVLVFLPPSYVRERNRRYPVVYALHGYSIGAEQWSQEIHVPQTIEGAFADHRRLREVHRRRCRVLHRRALPDDSESQQPRARRPLDGRLRRQPHRHEASRCVR